MHGSFVLYKTETGIMEHGEDAVSSSTDIVSVSYTHLDVYKRQLQKRKDNSFMRILISSWHIKKVKVN